MDDLKARWEQLEQPAKLAIGAAVVVVGLIVILKILPALVAAMGIGLLLVILFVPYWIPTIIAFRRSHPSKGGILVLNFFSGWTVAGWVVSLIWALSDNTVIVGQPTVVVNTNTTVSPTMSAFAGTSQPPPPPPPQQHQVGDVVNGHRFDGAAWVPHTPPAPTEPPPSSAADSAQTSA
jgi:energy-coupling factor transporter transmembrane protein EcfT